MYDMMIAWKYTVCVCTCVYARLSVGSLLFSFSFVHSLLLLLLLTLLLGFDVFVCVRIQRSPYVYTIISFVWSLRVEHCVLKKKKKYDWKSYDCIQ